MTCVLIPARRASTRLPEKLLLRESGQPLLAHTCRQAALAFGAAAVAVCADDEALVAIGRAAGVQAYLTAITHPSGTERIAEVARLLDCALIVNVQGDEPEIDPAHIRLVAETLAARPWAGMATLCVAGTSADQANPHAVKVVLGHQDRALYFTRAGAPWDRERAAPAARCHRHLGIYAYRRAVLLGYAALPESPLEALEKLEQLRALQAGIGIACAVVAHATPGIDVRADYDAFLARERARQASQGPTTTSAASAAAPGSAAASVSQTASSRTTEAL